MTTPRKNADIIHAYADGAIVQIKSEATGEWRDCHYPDFDQVSEYRIKPAAPKWPQTTMTEVEQMSLAAAYPCKLELIAKIANVALAHACETGLVVPAEVFSAKVSEIDMHWIDLTRQAAQRERELGDMLHEAVLAVHELDPHRKVRVPTPKPTVCMSEFRPATHRIKEKCEDRDMVIANNVRALCYRRHPYLVANEELQDIIDKAK